MATNNLLLDTHTFLWWIQDSKDLSAKSRKSILNPAYTCYLSAASVWEMSLKASIGKLELTVPVEQLVSEHMSINGFKLLDIGFRHVARVQNLPFYHRDPFDRLLIVQAQLENMTIVSHDKAFKQYDVNRLW
jgi:PIN domain nuclease of toxin-antitoxin system